MRKIIFGLNLILLLSVFCSAQKQKQEPGNLEDANSNQTKTGKSKDDSVLRTGTSLEAQLQQTLDVKSSEVGDTVILKVTKAIKQDNQVVVPKGAKLIGRVTEVKEKTKNSAMSKLGVVFDRIEGKNLNAPISASIVSITQATINGAAGDMFSSDISGSSTSSGSASSGSSGGGLLGGVTNTVGGVVNTTANTVGNVTNTASQTLGGTTQTLGRTINGIQISQSAETSANSSTTLSSQNKNIRLDKGTTFRLQLVN